MSRNFSWSNFTPQFLKSVIYASSTPKNLRPKVVLDDKDFLIPYMDRICKYPCDRFVRIYRKQIEDFF